MAIELLIGDSRIHNNTYVSVPLFVVIRLVRGLVGFTALLVTLSTRFTWIHAHEYLHIHVVLYICYRRRHTIVLQI